MGLDSIHRIGSMTKPITSLAVMMLVEEGRISLADPAFMHLPEFKDLKVGVEKKDDAGTAHLVLETPQRPMTVQDLLRHTSGLTYGIFGKSLVKDQYNAAKVNDPNQTTAEMITKLARIPLQYHPGTTWEYSVSTDVLGRIVEVVSGVDLALARIVQALSRIHAFKARHAARWCDVFHTRSTSTRCLMRSSYLASSMVDGILNAGSRGADVALRNRADRGSQSLARGCSPWR